MRLSIAPGTFEDYRRLARWHYRRAHPTAVVAILVARLRGSRDAGDAPMGVLVVTMPTFNGPWRRIAWPGVFERGSPAHRARVLNGPAGVRCISRVIVDPRCRGLGVARRLVRAYLRRPLTPRTEAVAAMACISPFFARAGMCEVVVPPTGRDIRLAPVLRAAGLAPVDFACPTRVVARLQSMRARGGASARCARAIARSLRTWARASRSTRPFSRSPLARLISASAVSLTSRRRVFVATHTGVCSWPKPARRAEPARSARPQRRARRRPRPAHPRRNRRPLRRRFIAF